MRGALQQIAGKALGRQLSTPRIRRVRPSSAFSTLPPAPIPSALSPAESLLRRMHRWPVGRPHRPGSGPARLWPPDLAPAARSEQDRSLLKRENQPVSLLLL